MKTNTAKKATFAGLVLAGAALLASCQVSPVSANTVITDANGAGNKTISMFCLVDGSVQMTMGDADMPGNNNYVYIDDATFSNPTFTPKENNFVSYIRDGYFTNPNKLTTSQAIWDEFNDKVRSVVPSGFTFTIDTKQSSGWQDSYMDQDKKNPDNKTNEWKAYVYHVSYSWSNVQEYITKTKTLIGTNYATSELADLDDANTAWVSFTKGENDTYTWKECYTVNYWSVYGMIDSVLSSNLFNRAALGADYAVATSSAFTISMQQYKIGEGDEVKVKVDNTSTTDAEENVKFIEASGKIAKKGCGGEIIGTSVVALAALAGVAALAIKRKKGE